MLRQKSPKNTFSRQKKEKEKKTNLRQKKDGKFMKICTSPVNWNCNSGGKIEEEKEVCAICKTL